MSWVPFSVSVKANISLDFCDQDLERFFVKMPCEDTVWFKLFLGGEDGANSHVEIKSRVS